MEGTAALAQLVIKMSFILISLALACFFLTHTAEPLNQTDSLGETWENHHNATASEFNAEADFLNTTEDVEGTTESLHSVTAIEQNGVTENANKTESIEDGNATVSIPTVSKNNTESENSDQSGSVKDSSENVPIPTGTQENAQPENSNQTGSAEGSSENVPVPTGTRENAEPDMRNPPPTNCERVNREPIIVDRFFSGTDLDPEHKLWYFRENYGINFFHMNWHMAHFINFGTIADRKDRSGELFYYIHNQFLARYEAERLSNGLARVAPLRSFRDKIDEGYFPKLHWENSGFMWGSRPEGLYLKDITIEYIFDLPGRVSLTDLERWKDRVLDAIHQGFIVYPNGTTASLMDTEGTPEGIDLLGRMLEASYSPNRDFYGNLHNAAHLAIAAIHDPDGKFLEAPGIMAWFGTTVRDPVFFRLHKFMDIFFDAHKMKLPPYNRTELSFDGVEVESIKVETPGNPENLLTTGWQRTDANLTMALDFFDLHLIPARFTHLQHKDFEYQIKVLNKNINAVNGTIRIFIAPKFDENNDEYTLTNQRLLMIEMDKFRVELQPGDNLVNRSSLESSLTIPHNQTFEEIVGLPYEGSIESYCGCGWPQHMLLPRGMRHGMQYSLIVMVTNATVDEVPQPNPQPPLQCVTAPSICGLYRSKYPDSRPMGFPWDRRIEINDYPSIRSFPGNTRSQDITIQFTDEFL